MKTVNDRYSPWGAEIIRGIADVVGETQQGLTGRQIGDVLAELLIQDPGSGITKRERLFQALAAHQAGTGDCRRLVTFLTRVMAPVRYRDDPALYTARQDALNEVLVHIGLRITDAGEVAAGPRATTLDEAAQHTSSLRQELRRRGTHPDVLAYCTRELLAKNAFHAMLEATKSVFDKIRTMSGLTGDGAALVDAALGLGQSGTPVLAINSLATVTERDEQKGLVNLIKGLGSLFRNPVAHDPRLHRAVTDDELLECLTTLSMVHRRLDVAVLLS